MLASWGGPDAIAHSELTVAYVLGPLSFIVSGSILSWLMEINTQRCLLDDLHFNKISSIQAACDALTLPADLSARVCRYHSYVSLHHVDQTSRQLLFSGL